MLHDKTTLLLRCAIKNQIQAREFVAPCLACLVQGGPRGKMWLPIRRPTAERLRVEAEPRALDPYILRVKLRLRPTH